MEAYMSSAEVLAQVKSVLHRAKQLSLSCDPEHADEGTNEAIDKLVASLVYLKDEAKTPESRFIFDRGSHEYQQEFARLVGDCEDDLYKIDIYLKAYSLGAEKLITNADGVSKLKALQMRIRSHANSFRMFPKRLKMAALPIMKRQLDTFIADIISGRKSYNVLAKVLNWEALERELDNGWNLQLDTDCARGRIRDREESQSAVTVVEYHSPSPKPPSPERSSPRPKVVYKPATVEDCDDDEDEVLLAAAGNKTDALLEEISSSPSSEEESDTTPPETKPSAACSSNISNSNPDPTKKPERTDTELLSLQSQKVDIKEQIYLLKKEAEALEKSMAEKTLLQKFREFREQHGTKDNEKLLLLQFRRYPPSPGSWPHSRYPPAFFVMPSGATYPYETAIGGASSDSYSSIPGVSPRQNTAIFSPSLTRSSTQDFANEPIFSRRDSFPAISPRGKAPKLDSSYFDTEPLARRPRVYPDVPRAESPERMLGYRVTREVLPITLEEAFSGTTKDVVVQRTRYNPFTGEDVVQPKRLSVTIPPGVAPGSKVTSAGDPDVEFVIQDEPHPVYRRVGADLYTTIQLTQAEARNGWKKSLPTLGGNKLRIPGPRNTHAEWIRLYPKHGMPRENDPSSRGTLIVGVKIV